VKRSLLLFVVVLLLVFVASCGDDDPDGGGVEILTKPEWIAAADAICVDMFRELDQIPEPQTLEESYELGERSIEIQRAALAELGALTPPEGDEAAVEEILDAHEALVDWGEEMIGSFGAGDQETTFELHADAERLAQEADQLMNDYGLRECLG
jgi:hypothetical protein